MYFTSYVFIAFLTVLILAYYLVPGKWQKGLLLAASYFFYGMADVRFLCYILVITAATFFAARMIGRSQERQKAGAKEDRAGEKAARERHKKIRRRWLVGCLILVLGILGVTKYSNFLISNINDILANFGAGRRLPYLNILLPMGISFYTFQAVGYLADVHQEKIPAEKNFFRYALFVSFFPQLIQGPISRYGDLAGSLTAEHPFCGDNLRDGLLRVFWGYFKKMVVADRIAKAVGLMVGEPEVYCGAYAAVLLLFYTIQLYADFTGGIDITIGIAQMMGIQVKENFVRPYFSKSLKEYWRRWHISMCTWFKDYVFYPLSISKGLQRASKQVKKLFGKKAGRRFAVYFTSFVVWLATGFWHGASWNFVVWGLLNWLILMVSEELEPLYLKFHTRFSIGKSWGYRLFQIGRTFLLICVLNLFDCFEKVSVTLRMLLSLFLAKNWSVLTDGSLLSLGLTGWDYVILLAGVLLMLAVSLIQRKGSVRGRIAGMPYPVRAAVWFCLVTAVIVWGAYGIDYDASQFIYNRF